MLASFDVATLYVRNVPEDVIEKLRAKAQAKGRSLNAEALEILEEAATEYEAIVDRIEEIAKRREPSARCLDPEEVIRELARRRRPARSLTRASFCARRWPGRRTQRGVAAPACRGSRCGSTFRSSCSQSCVARPATARPRPRGLRVDAQAVIAGFGELPLRVHSARALSRRRRSSARSPSALSGYDAFYVVLAEATDATLVTADRRLAEAYDRVELLA